MLNLSGSAAITTCPSLVSSSFASALDIFFVKFGRSRVDFLIPIHRCVIHGLLFRVSSFTKTSASVFCLLLRLNCFPAGCIERHLFADIDLRCDALQNH